MSTKFVEPTNIQELIRQICLRPAMFVGIARFELAAAYISGYSHALAHWAPEQLPQVAGWEWKFSRWVATKLCYPKNWVWSFTIKRAFPSDEAAFSALPQLFQEFLDENICTETKG